MATVGAKEQLDLLGVIDWVDENYEEPIGLLGISMGASTSLLAAAQTDDVIGVVADSPFSDLQEYLKVNLPVWSDRSEEHTSELQSRGHLVCRLLLEKKKMQYN